MFIPTKIQAEFYSETELPSRSVVFGPRGNGKTRAVIQKVHELISRSEPQQDAIVFWPALVRMLFNAANVLADTVYDEDLWAANRRLINHCYEYKGGSRFYYGATESFNAETFVGRLPNYIIIDNAEDVKFHHFLNIERVMMPYTKLIMVALDTEIPAWLSSSYMRFDKTYYFGDKKPSVFSFLQEGDSPK